MSVDELADRAGDDGALAPHLLWAVGLAATRRPAPADSCACRLGKGGDNCRDNLDECALGACVNGGACLDQTGYAHCTCAAGFYGAAQFEPAPLLPTTEGQDAPLRLVAAGCRLEYDECVEDVDAVPPQPLL